MSARRQKYILFPQTSTKRNRILKENNFRALENQKKTTNGEALTNEELLEIWVKAMGVYSLARDAPIPHTLTHLSRRVALPG